MLSQKVHTENARKFYFELFELSIKNNLCCLVNLFDRMLVRMRFTLIKMERRKIVIFDLIFFLKRGSNNVKRKNNEKLNKENKRLNKR